MRLQPADMSRPSYAPHVDSMIDVADDRRVAYADYGPQDGHPLVYLHGYPGSRLDLGREDLLAPLAVAGYRLIGVDRPGSGRTRFLPGRTYADGADDIHELAIQLDLDRLSLLSFSAGGMFALSFAARFPDRIHAVCMLSPAAPADMPGWWRSWRRDVRVLLAINRRAPALGTALLRANSRSMRTEQGAVQGLSKLLRSPADDDQLRSHADWALRFVREADRQGPVAFVEHARRMLNWPIGFSLEDVDLPISIFHGDADNLVSIMHSRYIAERLPRAHLEELRGHGHTPTAEVIALIAETLTATYPASKESG